MSVSLVVAGTSYTYPQVGETAWGAQATAWAQAVSTSMLQTSGGTFSLTADVNFGLTFGLISQYFTSASANPASAGAVRLANLDFIKWRNAANNADLGLKLDASNIFQLGAPLTITGNLTASNFSGSNTGDVTLAAFGSTPNANGLTLASQVLNLQPADGTHPGGVSTAAQTIGGIKTFSSPVLLLDGIVSAPGVGFSLETNTGFYRIGSHDLGLAVNGTLAFEINEISSTQMNVGLGGPASASVGTALSAPYTYNGVASFNYSNLSQLTSAVTQLYIGAGASGGNGITVENAAFATTAYTGGGGLLSAGPNLSFLNICAENGSAYMTFNVGGRTLATERMRLTATALTLNKGSGSLVLSGASSGALTLNPGATGTYSLNFPTTQGGSGTSLQNDGSGNFSWVSALSNPMTTKGDLITSAGSGTPARQAVGSNGQVVAADSTATNGISYQNPINFQNLLCNGAFDYWQAGTSATITATGGATPTNTYAYLADQWYANNILGGGTVEGIITYSQVTGVTNGSIFGAKLQITTAPTGTGIQNGCELYQPLSNKASYPLYNQTASFSVLVKALNNVNSVGVTLGYVTSEAKGFTAIGSEVNTTVNTSTFTSCTINGQALGTAQTVSGIIVARIRIHGVSSGNAYDLNNGFVCEQAMLNLGPVAMPFSRKYQDPAMELAACQYFYEVWNTAAASSRFISIGLCSVANTTGVFTFPFKVLKRIGAAVTADSAAHFTAANAATSAAITALSDGGSSVDCGCASVTLNGTYAASSALTLSTNNTAARLFFDARI